MKLTYVVAILALAGCGSKKDKEGAAPAAGSAEAKPTEAKPTESEPAKPTEPAKPAKTGRDIPNSKGLSVDAPAKWLDNGIGGAAGMHLDGDAGDFHLWEVAPEEAAKDMDTIKKETEEIMFEKWVSSKKAADGFELIYVLSKMEMKGDDMKKVGTTFGTTVRRKIGATLYTCGGAASTKEIAEEAVALCGKVTGE